MKKDIKKLFKKLLKEILLFRSELFITPLFIVVFILSLKYVGFYCIRDIIFNIMLFFTIPASYFGVKLSRRMIYEVNFGKVRKNEN